MKSITDALLALLIVGGGIMALGWCVYGLIQWGEGGWKWRHVKWYKYPIAMIPYGPLAWLVALSMALFRTWPSQLVLWVWDWVSPTDREKYKRWSLEDRIEHWLKR